MKSLLLVPNDICLLQQSRGSGRLGGGGTLDRDPQPEAGDQACAAPHRGLQADAVLIYLTNCASYVRLCLVSFLVNYLELKFTLESSKTKKGKEVAAQKSPVNFSCYDTLLGY